MASSPRAPLLELLPFSRLAGEFFECLRAGAERPEAVTTAPAAAAAAGSAPGQARWAGNAAVEQE